MKVKVTKLGFCDGLLPSLEELRALKRLKEVVGLLLDRRERIFSLDDPEELRALKQLKEIVCLLLDRGEWTFSLGGAPVGDERRTSIWNVAREVEASPKDRQYWAELRTLWSQLKHFHLSLFLGHSIADGELTGLDYESLLQSWRPKYEELSDVKRLKEVVCLLLDRGKWKDFPLVEPPVGDERRTSVWNVAREEKASPEDRQYWAELRSLWSQLQNVKSSLPPFHALPRLGHAIIRGEIKGHDCADLLSSWQPEYDDPARDRQYWAELRSLWSQLQNVRSPLPPFHALPQLGQAIVHGEITRFAYASLVHSWRPEYDEPETLHSRIHEALEKSQTEPVELDFAGFWVFKNNRYSIEGHYSIEEQKLLVLEEFDRERRHFERLHQKHGSAGSGTSQPARPRVPEAVRIEVWRRDGGRCSRCGSRENLEYDHIVPLAKGGSNTARNVELLCEKCNRSKADKIE